MPLLPVSVRLIFSRIPAGGLLPLLLIACLSSPSVASVIQVPSPTNSDCPAVACVNSSGGTYFDVIVRDNTGQPISGSSVSVDFAGCALTLCPTQPAGLTVAGNTVNTVTNTWGVARFAICGSVPAPSCAVTIRADGISLCTVSSKNLAQYTGRQLFEGILFGIGPVAAAIPEFWPQSVPSLTPQDTSRASVAVKLHNAALTFTQDGQAQNAQVLQSMADYLNDTTKIISPGPHGADNTRIFRLEAAIDSVDRTFFPRFEQQVQGGNTVNVASALREATTNTLARINVATASSCIDVWWYFDIVVAIEVLVVCIIAVPPCVLFTPLHTGGSLGFDQGVQLLATRFHPTNAVPGVSQSGLLIMMLGLLITAAVLAFRRRIWVSE